MHSNHKTRRDRSHTFLTETFSVAHSHDGRLGFALLPSRHRHAQNVSSPGAVLVVHTTTSTHRATYLSAVGLVQFLSFIFFDRKTLPPTSSVRKPRFGGFLTAVTQHGLDRSSFLVGLWDSRYLFFLPRLTHKTTGWSEFFLERHNVCVKIAEEQKKRKRKSLYFYVCVVEKEGGFGRWIWKDLS